MRKLRDCQTAFDFCPMHAETLRGMEVLQELVDELGTRILELVEIDLTMNLKNADTGAPGMSAQQVLHTALVKQMYGLSYRELRNRVEDSNLVREFAGYMFRLVPSASTLQENIKRIQPETWEEINTALIKLARKRKIDPGSDIRIDTTPVETNIHRPTDASLLWDATRVLYREMKRLKRRFPQVKFESHNRKRVIKKLLFKISNGTESTRPSLYRKMIAYAEEVHGYAISAVRALSAHEVPAEDWASKKRQKETLEEYAKLMGAILWQARTRVVKGEKVLADEKVVSIFEQHTDIIQKGTRDTVFGHKVCLAIGSKNLIHDCLILDGNPSDSDVFMDSLGSIKKKYNNVPSRVATDKGFGSSDNARKAKALGVEHLTFSRRKLEDSAEGLVATGSMEKALMRFRAGAEGIISAVKRGVNLARCTWRGYLGFCSYVWSSIVAHNMKMMVATLM